MAIGYKTLETGIWLDIFPFDNIKSDKKTAEIKDAVRNCVNRYRKYYLPNENKISDEEILKKKEMIFREIQSGDNTVCFHGPEFGISYYVVSPEQTKNIRNSTG